jgi:hypothetical protein
MARKTLEADIEALEEKLNAPGQGETVENLSKALADVSGALKKSVIKRGKKGTAPEPIPGAPIDPAPETSAALLNSLLEDDTPFPTTAPLAKTFTLGDDTTAVDVSEFVVGLQTDVRAVQALLTKGVLPKKVLKKALTLAMEAQQETLDTALADLKAGMATLCKAMGTVLDHLTGLDTAPVGDSRFASMEKSIAIAKAGLLAEGGTPFPMNIRNKELLSKAHMTRAIDDQQFEMIKKTQVLPPGVSLSLN